MKEQGQLENEECDEGTQICLINRFVCYPVSLPPSLRVMYYRAFEYARSNFKLYNVSFNHHDVHIKVTKYPNGYARDWSFDNTGSEFSIVFTIEDGPLMRNNGPKTESRLKIGNGEVLESIKDRQFFLKFTSSDKFEFRDTCSSFTSNKYQIEISFKKEEINKRNLSKKNNHLSNSVKII